MLVLAGDPGSITHRLLTQLGVGLADIKKELAACITGNGRRTGSRRGRRRRHESRCSFCGRPGGPGDRLVSGPGVFICDDCARLALEISEGS